LRRLATTVPLPVELDVCPEPLPDDIATTAYYVASEAVSNAIKHAGADSIAVKVARDAGRLPFGVGTDKEREVHRVSKLVGENLLTLDLLVVTPVFERVWEQRETFLFEDRRLQVVSAEGLAMMKRIAGRDQDLLDLKILGFKDEGDDGK